MGRRLGLRHALTFTPIACRPEGPASFREVAEAYIDKMQSLGLSVIEALALGLGVEPETLLGRVNEAFWNLSVLGYEGHESSTPAKSGIGEHSGPTLYRIRMSAYGIAYHVKISGF